MGFFNLSIFVFAFFSCCSSSVAQQPYIGQAITDCGNDHNSSSGLGYSCNGVNRSCQTYLTFRSEPPYNTVSAISSLLAADPSQISEMNSVSETETLDTNKLVIVPINCSCSGEYYQANTTYAVEQNDIFLFIANNTFQGLSTCQAIRNQNSNLNETLLLPGTRISVPLRCACPTKNQSGSGVNYLMSYLMAPGEFVFSLSERFGVDANWILEANDLSLQSTVYPYTTLLVPLENPPTSSQTIAPPPPPPPPPSSPPSSNESPKKTWLYALLGALGGTALILVVGAIIFCIFFRKNKKSDSVLVSESHEAQDKSLKRKMEEESQDFLESLSEMAQSIKVYNFKELQLATNDFSHSSLIEGSVYRGDINGDLAAIKKMDGDVSKEINLLQKINHSNLIRLSGVCFNEGHWYLVYEYAAKGPLSDWLYYVGGEDGKFLNWIQRIQIALDVATGLNYLHSFATPPHVHKDIKSSNILLDSDFRAKIANFGLARSAEAEEGHFSLTKHVVGTIGYMAPEYLENGLISTKLDVYSFGILLLEMITGKEVSVLFEGNMNLSDALNDVLGDEGEESLRKLMDPSMEERYPIDLAGFVVKMIESCLQKNPGYRPSMDEIVQSLSRIISSSFTWESSNNIAGYNISS
ncbi:hypothetical protein UlMin_039456 [Ulmus minor]